MRPSSVCSSRDYHNPFGLELVPITSLGNGDEFIYNNKLCIKINDDLAMDDSGYSIEVTGEFVEPVEVY